MATFITTLQFTEQGIKSIRESPKRAAAFKAAAKKMGLKVTNIYWTIGDTDGVLIFDAPNDEAATAAVLIFHRKVTSRRPQCVRLLRLKWRRSLA